MKSQILVLPNGQGSGAISKPVAIGMPGRELLLRVIGAAALVLAAVGAEGGVTLTSLHSFQVSTNGINPAAGLIRGSDGYFYGTTEAEEQGAAGTVFRLTIGTAAPVFTSATLSDGMLALTWSTEAGGNYQLQFPSNLNSRTWTDLGSPVASTGSTFGVTNALSNGPQVFYRVEMAP